MRVLTDIEFNEIIRLANEVIEENNLEENNNDEKILDFIGSVSVESEGNKNPNENSFKLGSLYGKIIEERYKWEWRFVQRSTFDYYGLVSPNSNWFIPVHSIFYMIFMEGKENNTKLLFNMLENIDDNVNNPNVVFLN
jgi:hypothetical protein